MDAAIPCPICISINSAVWAASSNESWQSNSHYAASSEYEMS